MSETKVRVLIAEDHQTVREGMRLLIAREPDLEVVGEAADGSEALRLACALLPDVVLMDLSMPGMNGLRATRSLQESCPRVKVLALTRHDEYGSLSEMLRAGARGYVLKQSPPADLVRAVRAVAAGRSYLDPAVTGKVVNDYAGGRAAGGAAVVLSEREDDVLRLIARGHSNKEIAARFGLSVKTVESHKANSTRKLGLADRAAIVDYAILRGWMQND